MLTDHEGKFEFDQFLATGGVTLQVTKPGFYSSADGDPNSNTALRSDQLTTPIIVRLYPEGLLTGTITAPDGTPLPQVMVTAQRSMYNDTGHQWMAIANNMTNSRGEFRLPVPAGDYRIETGFSPRMREANKIIIPLVVPAANSIGTSETIHLSSGAEEHFDLHPTVGTAYAVKVHLESWMERAVPNLIARSSDGTVLPVNTRNGQDGDLTVELPSGTYSLIASFINGETTEYGETTVTITDHPVSGVVLRMFNVPAIPVRLIVDSGSTSDKAPPTIQQLGLMIESMQDSPLRRGGFSTGPITSRDQESYFRAPPGTYRLMARNTGQWFVSSATYGSTDLLQQELTIAPGSGSSSIVVTVSNRTGNLQGTAMINGVAASTWIYLVLSGPSAAAVYTVRSGQDGSFTSPYLPAGTYQSIAFETRHAANYRDPKALAAYSTYMHSVTVNAGDKTTLEINAVPATELLP